VSQYYESLFASLNQQVGIIGGDTFDIWRPDYTQSDNTPVLVAAAQQFRVDPVTGKFAEPRFQGVEYYDIFGPISLVQPGDILMKTTPDSRMTPAVTIEGFYPLKAVTGFRSSRTCNIMNSATDTPVFTNVYFDFMGEGFPGSSINRNLEQSLKIPSTSVVLFRRDNISRLRMHLFETDIQRTTTLPDGTTQPFIRKWNIEEIDMTGNLMVLTLRGA
jgi:hypothetical protein